VAQLQERVAAQLPSLPPKQRIVAQLFLTSWELFALHGIQRLAALAEVNAATVFRFCRSVGYGGFTDFQTTLRAALSPPFAETAAVLDGSFAINEDVDPLDRAFSIDANLLDLTWRSIDRDAFSRAVDLLAGAGKVLALGFPGAPAGFVNHLSHSARSFGFPIYARNAGGFDLFLDLMSLTKEDALLVVSFQRGLRDVVQAVEYARSRDVATIAITDSRLSSLARLAEVPLIIRSSGLGFHLATTPAMTVVHAIVLGLVKKDPVAALRALEQVDDELSRGPTIYQEMDKQRPTEPR
jgi:DNA-binding MurR/RpiR family transcriptional regulator